MPDRPHSSDASPRPDGGRTVSFGARDVGEGEKAGLVRAVFDQVAPAYDAMNDLMSVGVHRAWKSTLLDRLAPQPGQRLIDVAGGTGDVALGFLRRAATRPQRGRAPAEAVVCDINHAMMAAGRERADAQEPGVSRVCGDAEALPFEDGSFDLVTGFNSFQYAGDPAQALRMQFREG